MKPIRILYLMPDGQRNSPVRYYRGDGVLERLREMNGTPVEIIYPTQGAPVWRELLRADVVFFMRCYEEHHLQIMQSCLDQKIPVWYDLDDNLFEVPRENPAYGNYMRKAVREGVLDFLASADLVTVSTKELANVVVKAGGNAPLVIPNALDEKTFHVWDEAPEVSPRKVITWRGGASHLGDLHHFAKEFWQFFENTKDWNVHFMGLDPWWVANGYAWNPKAFGDRVSSEPYTLDYNQYLWTMRMDARPKLHVVPLVDNSFNRCKSNIAALEAIFAGAVPIVPADFEEFQIPGAMGYSHKDGDMASRMIEATEMSESKRLERLAKCRAWLGEKALLSKMNRMRGDALVKLLEVKP